MSASNADKILVALNTSVDRKVNFYCRQDFGSSGCSSCQFQQLTEGTVYSRFLVALKATLSTLIVDGRHSDYHVLGTSESYKYISS